MKFLFLLVSFVSSISFAQLRVYDVPPIQAPVANSFLTGISASGSVSIAQPAFTNLTGTIGTAQVGQLPVTVFNSGTSASSSTFLRGDNTWSAPTVITAPPTVQTFTSSSGTYNKNYTFVITSGNATVGATYTNNAVTFTVYATVSSATQVVMSGSGAPASSGTLTKSTGTGDATLTFSQVLAPLYLVIEMVGGGGAGGTSGSTNGATGGSGGSSTFGTLTANGGSGGGANHTGGAGGAGASAGSNCDINLPGGSGTTGAVGGAGGQNAVGGMGGSTYYGGGGTGGYGGAAWTAGGAAATNTGGGGGGGSATNTSFGGGGGGAGGFCKKTIGSPSATYSYAVGAGGTSTAGAGSQGAGGVGAAGLIAITEIYP